MLHFRTLYSFFEAQLTFLYTHTTRTQHAHAHTHTHTHTQSQNHGEYVFDAGSEASKQQWIKTIQQFSNKQPQNQVANGRLPQ